MLPSLTYSNRGIILNPISPFQPKDEIRELLSVARIDIEQGDEVLNRPFNEFNNQSLIERANLDQKDWLAWSDSPSADPDESWMFTGTSSATRNKIVSTAAHLTKLVLYPRVFSQNGEDEEDEAFGYVMENAVEYNCRRSNYEQTFLYAVISGLVNPVSYFNVQYAEQYQEVLEGTQSNYTRKKVLDEMMSGFQHALLPLDEVLLSNPYCFDIQKQPFVIHRRRIGYTEAKAIYGGHQNFVHVRPGVVSFNASDGLFYDVEDVQDGLVEECRLYYRGRDMEFPVVNGVYLGNPNADYNPFRHRRIQKHLDEYIDVPVLPIVKYGAEPIDAMRFAYFKSLAAKLANDKELVDRMRQNAVDASTFATFPSILTMGAGKLDRSVFIPATTTEIGKDAKMQPASGFANPAFAYKAAKEAEQAMNETSLDPQLSGVSGGDKTARESILLQQNAINNLGVMGRMITQGLVKPVGELMIDDIVRYQTVGEVLELSGGSLGMKYRTLVLNDKIKDGKKKNVIIRFTDTFAGRSMSEKERETKNVELYNESGDDKEIYEANPALVARRQYLIVVEPDALLPKNDSFERTFKMEVYDHAINNPLIAGDPEKLAEVTRDFLFEPTVKGEGAKYIPKDTRKVLQGIVPAPPKGLAGRVVENGAMQGLGAL